MNDRFWQSDRHRNGGYKAMREILFRGKDINTGEWVYGDLIYSSRLIEPIAYSIHESSPGGRTRTVIPGTIGQYTGLEDKTGKKIYEGDVARCHCDYYKHKTGVIKWNGADAMWKIFFPDEAAANFEIYSGSDFEVIGNIFDGGEANDW